ncbi:MAG: hypothetical protein IMW97_01040 [Firmicutes bacterium]|nr:hypothetical protein [Candidatus Fermentithermobacillaceae bacterium]
MIWTVVFSGALLLLGVFALEMSILPAQLGGHAWADPLAALVSAVGWRWGSAAGFASGTCLGLLEDCLVCRFIGHRAVGLALAGLVSGASRKLIERDAFFSLSMVGAVACVTGDLATYAALWIQNIRLSPRFLITQILPYQALSGALLVLPADVLINLIVRQYVWAVRRRPAAGLGTRG